MHNFQIVISKCIEIMNTRLNIFGFIVTPMSIMIGMFILSIALYVIKRLMD